MKDSTKRLIWGSVMLLICWVGIWVVVLVGETLRLKSGEKIIFTLEKN